jgi:hypothetical protein
MEPADPVGDDPTDTYPDPETAHRAVRYIHTRFVTDSSPRGAISVRRERHDHADAATPTKEFRKCTGTDSRRLSCLPGNQHTWRSNIAYVLTHTNSWYQRCWYLSPEFSDN